MATISGTVMKQNLNNTEALPSFGVQLDDKLIFTNDKGKFHFWDVPPGHHVVRINDSMYAPYAKVVLIVTNNDKIDLGTILMRWNGL